MEGATAAEAKAAPLTDWMPPPEWGASAHSKHLRNLYIYFWRWATWKVFDHHPSNNTGIVCFITVAGFLNGPGFQAMRAYLRSKCDDIWVIDCSPEGHQPEVNTRVFQAVQQPICIVLAARSAASTADRPASVRFRALPKGHRQDKFDVLAQLSLTDDSWSVCPLESRAPFLPASAGNWAGYPGLEDFFIYNGSGVMAGRTWVIAPDALSLQQRWKKLAAAPPTEKEVLFHPHLRAGKPGDKHSKKVVGAALTGFPNNEKCVADENGDGLIPIRYGFRSFDRQWLMPDSRLINQPNPALWDMRSGQQIYLTAPSDRSPSTGPALTFSALIPDLHHYNGRGGRTFPLWADVGAKTPNIRPQLINAIEQKLGIAVPPADLLAYIAAVAAHPGYTARFCDDFSTPGLRIPLTADGLIFTEVVEVGRSLVWLQTFGERMVNAKQGRPAEPPRLPLDRRPHVPLQGAIPQEASAMPDAIGYDLAKKQLLIGSGYVENVDPAVWQYEVSGKQVLLQWFSYRKKTRERPIMGDRRKPSPLTKIQPDSWLAEYTTELLNVLNVIGWLVELEPTQAALLDRICAGPLISVDDLRVAGAMEVSPTKKKSKAAVTGHPDLFANPD